MTFSSLEKTYFLFLGKTITDIFRLRNQTKGFIFTWKNKTTILSLGITKIYFSDKLCHNEYHSKDINRKKFEPRYSIMT